MSGQISGGGRSARYRFAERSDRHFLEVRSSAELLPGRWHVSGRPPDGQRHPRGRGRGQDRPHAYGPACTPWATQTPDEVSGGRRWRVRLEAWAVAVRSALLDLYGPRLAYLTDDEHFPHLRAALAEGSLDDDSGDFGEEEFGFGLRTVLDGIQANIDRLGAGQSAQVPDGHRGTGLL